MGRPYRYTTSARELVITLDPMDPSTTKYIGIALKHTTTSWYHVCVVLDVQNTIADRTTGHTGYYAGDIQQNVLLYLHYAWVVERMLWGGSYPPPPSPPPLFFLRSSFDLSTLTFSEPFSVSHSHPYAICSHERTTLIWAQWLIGCIHLLTPLSSPEMTSVMVDRVCLSNQSGFN